MCSEKRCLVLKGNENKRFYKTGEEGRPANLERGIHQEQIGIMPWRCFMSAKGIGKRKR